MVAEFRSRGHRAFTSVSKLRARRKTHSMPEARPGAGPGESGRSPAEASVLGAFACAPHLEQSHTARPDSTAPRCGRRHITVAQLCVLCSQQGSRVVAWCGGLYCSRRWWGSKSVRSRRPICALAREKRRESFLKVALAPLAALVVDTTNTPWWCQAILLAGQAVRAWLSPARGRFSHCTRIHLLNCVRLAFQCSRSPLVGTIAPATSVACFTLEE